ncbi:MAG: alcohol dehydrogenase class IV [Halioglobus sp.]|jgi:alcohol dehydrogenase class IV
MVANINLPRILRVGAGASKTLVATLRELCLRRPLIVTDSFMVQAGYSATLEQQLNEASFAYGLFGNCVPDPTTDSIDEVMAVLRDGDYDCVIGLGGGSSMDTAKAVAAMALLDGAMRDYKVPYKIDRGLPIIAVPTTAGTGSEVTSVAIITDTSTREKMLCMGLGLMPIAALVDYECTLSMPYRLTADTGIDSLCHALEAYVSRKANSFTDSVALTAMHSIYNNIRTACDQPDNIDARAAMMLAATQGGIAFANASVTLIHGMSRPIGALFHVPHGLSNAMLLPEITAWSVHHAPERYAHCARYMGIAKVADSDSVALDKLVDGLRQLSADLAVPTPRDYGIDEQEWKTSLVTMAEQALASGSPANNPRIPKADDIISLYEKVYG